MPPDASPSQPASYGVELKHVRVMLASKVSRFQMAYTADAPSPLKRPGIS